MAKKTKKTKKTKRAKKTKKTKKTKRAKKTEKTKKTKRAKKTEKTAIDEKDVETKYAFPSRSRCPRCGALDTVCYATKANVQYRRCTRSVCRRSYQIIGEKV